MNPCSPRLAGRLLCLLALTAMASTALAKSADTDAERRHRIAQVVNRALEASPEIAAAQSAIQAAKARLTGAGLPLNNPELEAEAENTDINTYRLGINQTVDWHDKRGALEHVARQELLLAQAGYEALKLEKSSELLAAIGRITILQEIVELARQRTELLARFEKLAMKRHAAGDIPRNDLELARLSLAEASMHKRVFDLVKDFGTSESPKSTRSSTTHWCPGRPGHPAFRHNIASSLRLHTGLPYDWTPRSDAPLGSPLAPSARRVSRVASRLPGTTCLRFALHGGQRQARRRSELLQARTDFRILAGRPLPEPLQLPLHPGNPAASDSDETLARQHPEVQRALIAAQAARQQVLSADRGRKADPTFGLAAGQEDSETLVALSFSLPLQVRNDFQSDVDAARAEALQADQLAQQSYRRLRAQITGSRSQYRTMAAAWNHWMDSGQVSLGKRVKLLDTLWQSGEISTTDYLLQLQQTLDTRITGTELQGELWSTWVRWLAASGTLDHWLNGK